MIHKVKFFMKRQESFLNKEPNFHIIIQKTRVHESGIPDGVVIHTKWINVTGDV